MLLVFCTFSFAQNFEKRKEKIKALKIAVISQRLELTSEEAEKFWPVFNKYDDQILDLREQKIKLRMKGKNATDEENLKLFEQGEDIEGKISDLKKKMRAELIPIVGAAKVVKLQKIEQEFLEKILEKLKNQKEKRNKD